MLKLRYPRLIIKRVRAVNFHSFEDETFALSKFNVLIGANASGKSNFISIFQFLKDLVQHGLENAISMQGGTPFLRNINIGAKEPLIIELSADVVEDSRVRYTRLWRWARITEFDYRIVISFRKKGRGYSVAEEELRAIGNVLNSRSKPDSHSPQIGPEVTIGMERRRGRAAQYIRAVRPEEETHESVRELHRRYRFRYQPHLGVRMSLLETGLFDEVTYSFSQSVRNFSIYDIDPKVCKEASQISGKVELEPNGSNLALILSNIFKTRKSAKRFTALIKSLLPFVEGIKVQKRSDKSLLANLDEVYSEKLLPAPFISDGTINLTALIVALYFEDKNFMVIEEPERNIHPHLISKLVRMMKDVSDSKQLIVTTHNPEIVRHAGIEDLLLLRRNAKGFSEVQRPRETEEVKVFLSKDMGLGDLFVENLLEG